jgi:hypothetical protein
LAPLSVVPGELALPGPVAVGVAGTDILPPQIKVPERTPPAGAIRQHTNLSNDFGIIRQ